jgi:hypothetical protein
VGKGKKKVTSPLPETAAGVLIITVDGQGNVGYELESELSPEIIEDVLRRCADEVAGKIDRAANAWGRGS